MANAVYSFYLSDVSSCHLGAPSSSSNLVIASLDLGVIVAGAPEIHVCCSFNICYKVIVLKLIVN